MASRDEAPADKPAGQAEQPRFGAIRGGATPGRSAIWRKGLTRKLFGKIFPIVAFFVLATQVVITLINYNSQLEQQTESAQLMATLTADAVAGPVWDLDRSIYVPQIKALEHDQAFRAAELIDENGTVLLKDDLPSLAETRNKVEVKAPLLNNNQKIGELTLVLSSDSLRQSVLRQVYIAIGVFCVLMAGLILALSRSVLLYVQKPLDRLLTAMADVERKRWTTVDVADDDEIGRVSSAFNTMVEGLRAGDEAKRLLSELEVAHAELESANRLILDSINYASKIQSALLPDPGALGDGVAAVEVIWQPLHLVGGDYFWLERLGRRSVIIVTDCTGHGVPGAFMTMIAASAIAEILHQRPWSGPAEVLRILDGMVRARLRQDRPETGSDDGLDAAMCVWDPDTRTVTYAGANIPLICRRGIEVEELKAARTGLGYRNPKRTEDLVDHVVNVEPGSVFYLFTDGVQDHMGGEPRRLLGRKRLAAMLAERPAGEDLGVQLSGLQQELDAYRGENARRDDMTMVAFAPL